jgi:hypothetical protein
MGYCDPKAIRNGKAWADVVNTPGFMNPTCPACPHHKGFRCLQCWPKSVLLPKGQSLKIKDLKT